MTTDEVRNVYEKTLVIPTQKHVPQFMLCVVGLVGAGKSTVMKPLTERLGAIRIAGDDIRKILKEDGQGYDSIFDIAAALHKKYLAMGYSTAVDSDAATPHTQEFIAECAKAFNLAVVWIHVDPPEEFILNKLHTIKHTWLFKDADEAIQNYNERKVFHTNLTMPFSYTFDTSRSDIADQIEEAAVTIEKKLH